MSVPPVHTTFDRQMCRRIAIPAWTANGGKQCVYCTGFIEGTSGTTTISSTNWYWGSKNPDVMLQLVRTVTGGGTISGWELQRGKLWQTDYSCKHQVHNTTTARVKVVGYKCRIRRDVPRNTANLYEGSGNSWRYPTIILGNGFRANGIGTSVGEANQGMNLPQFSPFESYDFCKAYQILEIHPRIIEPGEKTSFSLKDKRKLKVIPELLQPYFSSIETWSDITNPSGDVRYEHVQGEQFWLFKLMSDTVGEVVDSNTDLATMPEMEAMITTEFRCEGEVQLGQSVNTEYGRAIAMGFTVPGGFEVEVINPETEEKNKVEEL